MKVVRQLSYYSTFTPMFHTPVKQDQAANGPNGIGVTTQRAPVGIQFKVLLLKSTMLR